MTEYFNYVECEITFDSHLVERVRNRPNHCIIQWGLTEKKEITYPKVVFCSPSMTEALLKINELLVLNPSIKSFSITKK